MFLEMLNSVVGLFGYKVIPNFVPTVTPETLEFEMVTYAANRNQVKPVSEIQEYDDRRIAYQCSMPELGHYIVSIV